MRSDLRRLEALFAVALAAAGCDGDASSTTTDADCSQACACYKPPPPEVVRKPYEPKCAETGGDAATASDASDAEAGDAGDAAPCDDYLDCAGLCGPAAFGTAGCRLVAGETGKTEVECTYPPPPCGRATEGQSPVAAPRDVVSWLAAAASLEAGAVAAFERLARELAEHGAPPSLIREAERAARDEIRHARVMTIHARRHGATPSAPERAPLPSRALERIARENAVEGCVRETFGALLATHQARAATDPKLRASFARIARDETRHAALSHAIHRWALSRLPGPARRRVARARRDAVEALDTELRSGPTTAMRTILGLPDALAARRMFRAMVRAS